MNSFDQDSAKRAVAEAALSYLPESGLIGLGTGSTARHFIDGVGRLVKSGRDLTGVPTSEESRMQAESLGIPLAPIDGPWDIAVTVDGADEVSQELDLIKGGGGAHTREKIVNNATRFNIILIDESKMSTHLGEQWKLPVEVLAFAHEATRKALEVFAKVTQRTKNGSAWVTDSGGYLYDLHYGVIENPRELDTRVRALPGVVETGLFCGRADLVLVAGPQGVRKLKSHQ